MKVAHFSIDSALCTLATEALGCLLFLLTVCFFAPVCVQANTYYVSTVTGNDSNSAIQAKSLATPWKTIQQAANNMTAGDTCLIESGTYRELVTVSTSGSLNAPITFQSDTGQSVMISGAEAITGWTQESDNLYFAPMSWTMSDRNQVFQGGAMKPEARWPNAGSGYPWQNSTIYPSPDWSYVSTTGMIGGNAWLTDVNLPSRPDAYWNGATIHIMAGAGWYVQDATVIGYSSLAKYMAITYTGTGDAYGIINGNEYYLSGLKGELDSPGEWLYDTGNARLYFYSLSVPTNIEAKKRDYGFNLSRRSYVRLISLGFFGCTIQSSSSSATCTFDGLSMKYLGHAGTRSSSISGLTLRNGFVLRNSNLGFDSNYLIQLAGSNARVINNDLHDSGYAPVNEMIFAASTSNAYNLISHNSIHESGRGLMSFPGRAAIVEYNDMYNAMKLATDGGVMHTNGPAEGTVVRYNLMHDALGGAHHTGNSVQGFYLDNYNANYIVHHNIIWNINGHAFQFNNYQNFLMVFNNTCWNTAQGALATAFASDATASDLTKVETSSGTNLFNNLFNSSIPNSTTWNQSKFRNNLVTDPQLINPPANFQLQSTSPAINQGVVVPAVTDGYVGSGPDLGAMEYGKPDWTVGCGYHQVPPVPDPTYGDPGYIFGNRVQDCGFESGTLALKWVATPPANASLLNANSWTDRRVRLGMYSLVIGGTGAQVQQSLTGLLPGHRYGLYVAMKGTDPAQTLRFGAKNFGYSTLENTIVSDSNWHMCNLTFITGTNTTTADIYVAATIPSGVGTPVYVDDLCVQLCQAPNAPNPSLTPIIYYPFCETSGSSVADHGSSALSGTFFGTMTGTNANGWVAGKIGNAISLNGVDGYVMTPPIATPAQVTVACWVKSKSATWNDNACFFAKRPSFFLTGVSGSTSIRTDVFVRGAPQRIIWTPPAGFDLTQWHHYAEVANPLGGVMKLYVDGVLVATTSFTAGPIDPDDAGSFFIGEDDSLGRYLFAFIDDARIYNYAMTDSQVAQIALFDSSLLVYMKLDDGVGATSAADCAGVGPNGTLYGVNAADWTSGRIGGALHLTGSSNIIVPALTMPQEFTLSCWVKSNTATWNDNACFFAKRPSFFLTGVLGTSNIRTDIFIGGSPLRIVWTPPTGFDITKWHHYAEVVTPSSGVMYLYIDGVLAATTPFTPGVIDPDDNGDLYIGKDDYPGRYLKGTMDDVRIYSRALTVNELIELFLETDLPEYSSDAGHVVLTAPVVTLCGSNPRVFEASAAYADPGATAVDSGGGVLTPQITANTVVPNLTGTYAITWSATDASTLVGSVTRVVRVTDTTPPTLNVPDNIVVTATGASGAASTFTTSGSDVSGFVTITNTPASGSLFPIGVTTVTSTALDASGNSAKKTFNVTVTPPIGAREMVAPPLSLVSGTARLTVKSSLAGRIYQVQTCDDLVSGHWSDVGPVQTGSGGDINLSIPIETTVLRRFYRVKLN